MKSILRELYYGKIVPWEQSAATDPQLFSCNQKINKEKDFFQDMLSTENYLRLEKLESLYASISSMEEAESFAYGFKLAVRLMIEVFMENEKPG